MELVLQCTAAALLSAMTSLLLKRYHPELSFSLSALTLTLILLCCLRLLSGADIGIATTGIAGPSGGTEEKPVGTVYVGISTKNDTNSFELKLGADLSRAEIRECPAEQALALALETLLDES